jgi:hypothetical protein
MIGKIWRVSNFCRNYVIQEQLMKMNSKRKRIVLLQNGETLKNKLNTYSSSSSPYFFFLLLFLEIITKVKLFMGGVNVVIMFGKDLEIKKLTQNIQVM